MAEKEEFNVNPYAVQGKVDYDKLIREFGVEKLNDKLLARIKKQAGELHFLLRRKMYKMLLSMHNLRTQKKNMKKFWNFQHMLSLQQIANSTTS